MNLPSQVKLIPMIHRKKMPEYYSFADAIIGNMRIGDLGVSRFGRCYVWKTSIIF